MSNKTDLQTWIIEALQRNGGTAQLLDVAKDIWGHHEADLRERGDLFYTWQYDLRWAGLKLRKADVLLPASDEERGVWRLREGRSAL